jgi:hypothetical protein
MSKDTCYLIQPGVKVAVVYCHVPDDPQHASWAYNLINTWNANPPGYPCDFVVACAHKPPSDQMHSMLRLIAEPSIFIHDDKGWDIGAYQAFAKVSQHDMMVCLGGSSYLRRADWLVNMVEAFIRHGPTHLYGSMGNNGEPIANVSPHLRSTGFWCSPHLMNSYPYPVTDPSQRYPFEHGPNCFTGWVYKLGRRAIVVDAEGDHDHPHFNDSPNGFHRGNQSALLVGDRLTQAPYFAHP